MKTDQSQDKYNEIFREIKEEKLDWNFEDFLKKTEEKQETPIIPIQKKNGGSMPKIFWMAASLVLIAGLFFVVKNLNRNKVQETDLIVKNEILRQKMSGEIADTLNVNHKTVAVNDTVKPTKKDTLEIENSTAEEVSIDKILPKRGRLRRNVKPIYAQNNLSDSKDSTKNIEYNPNYVIINGQKIESEKEAIDVTKYSFKMFSDKVAKTVATTTENLNFDY